MMPRSVSAALVFFLMAAGSAGASMNVRIDGRLQLYSLFRPAYDDAANGAVLQANQAWFVENLTLNESKTVKIKGGYDPAFSAQNGRTRLQGTLAVRRGKAVVDHLTLSAPLPAGTAQADEGSCRACHAATVDPLSGGGLVAGHLASSHAGANVGCQGCHGGGALHNGTGPLPYPNPYNANRCSVCHTDPALAPLFERASAGFAANDCARCHTESGAGGVHAARATSTDDCVYCHAVAAPRHGAGQLDDNNGVRAITGEFAKWSHHVTGVTLNAAHCAVCHLEGEVVSGKVVVDATRHLADARVHLRHAGTDQDLAWDPAAPNHSLMDSFCMSCHSAAGASSPVNLQLQAILNETGLAAPGKTASPKNPFGDTISNRYDKMERPGVIDVGGQFNVSNNSHHAVKGPRYSGRTRIPGLRQILSPATFAQNSSALLQGARSTMFDAGGFNALYTPLGDAGGEGPTRTGSQGLGDDSTLHCGDCHTVGQWRPGSAVGADGSPTPAAIGAHGSNNEYLLRNSTGTDQRHTQNAYTVDAEGTVSESNPGAPYLVCYNCHAYAKYGALSLQGAAGGHAGEYDRQGRGNGIGNTLPFNGYTTAEATDGTRFLSRFMGPVSRFAAAPAFAPGYPLFGTPAAGEQDPQPGNVFGIQCLDCHNSGLGNAYGGIHGSANNTSWNDGTATIEPDPSVGGGAYIDGLGNTTRVERFLPGLSNAMYVPGTLGGYLGGSTVPGTVGGYLGGTTFPDTAGGYLGGSTVPGTAGGYPGGTTVPGAGSYTTGGITRDTNWEQKHWLQAAGTIIDSLSGEVAGAVSSGAGCYTLGTPGAPPVSFMEDVAGGLRGPSVTGEGGAVTTVSGTWGGCDDHAAGQGAANRGFLKSIVRPVTY